MSVSYIYQILHTCPRARILSTCSVSRRAYKSTVLGATIASKNSRVINKLIDHTSVLYAPMGYTTADTHL